MAATTICPNCKQDMPLAGPCPTCSIDPMSVVTDTLDSLVEAASIPSLASLFQKAKDKGIITPVSNYGGQNAGA